MSVGLTEETAGNGRAKNGQFGKGNTFANGNPYTKRVAHFRKIITDSITDSDLSDVIATLVENAKQGDIAATKLLLSYAVGQPQTFENPDHVVCPPYLLNILVKEVEHSIRKHLMDMEWKGTSVEDRILGIEKKFSALLDL